mmetsp:Transcript_29203/g.45728  ORF Transcript_29203/g.45728 Transcript_29203/m.45728 type:complete len:281 (-) Transcript_29203:4-846(-)
MWRSSPRSHQQRIPKLKSLSFQTISCHQSRGRKKYPMSPPKAIVVESRIGGVRIPKTHRLGTEVTEAEMPATPMPIGKMGLRRTVAQAAATTEEAILSLMIGKVAARAETMAIPETRVVVMEEDTEALVAAIVMGLEQVVIISPLDEIATAVVIIHLLAVMVGDHEAMATTQRVAMVQGMAEAKVAMATARKAALMTIVRRTVRVAMENLADMEAEMIEHSHMAGAEVETVIETAMEAANRTHLSLPIRSCCALLRLSQPFLIIVAAISYTRLFIAGSVE